MTYRLGLVCARRFGLVFALSAMVNLAIPRWAGIGPFLPALAAMLAVAAGFVLVGGRQGGRWILPTYLVGLLGIAAFLVDGATIRDASTLATVTALSSVAIPSLLLAIGDGPRRYRSAVIGGVPVLALAVVVSLPSGRAPFVGVAILGGWAALSFAGLWLAKSADRAEAGVARLREAYAAERRSTESEAQLRYGARVLHDTVLATLSLIAHAGAGVPSAALRSQAAADSELLGRLRTEGTLGAERPLLPPRAAGGPVGGLREELQAWADGHGLALEWHGDPVVEPDPVRREALAGAAVESLGNVRRHSGAQRAEVTLSQDERWVRVVVTDAGAGFDPQTVPRERLGIAQSIEARMAAVGGSARVFSSVGRGTTVMLEAPR